MLIGFRLGWCRAKGKCRQNSRKAFSSGARFFLPVYGVRGRSRDTNRRHLKALCGFFFCPYSRRYKELPGCVEEKGEQEKRRFLDGAASQSGTLPG
jgi:hypothetical protein